MISSHSFLCKQSSDVDVIQQKETELHTEPTGPEGEKAGGAGPLDGSIMSFQSNSKEKAPGPCDSSDPTLGLSEDTSHS